MDLDTRNKEISWLSFNDRLLQEASSKGVPLIERLKFLGIYSDNLDEFFGVRVAILRRLAAVDKAFTVDGHSPREVIGEIEKIVVAQRKRFEAIYTEIIDSLRRENIFIIDETELSSEQGKHVASYFKEKIRPRIMPILLKKNYPLPVLHGNTIYLAVQMTSGEKATHALIEVPSKNIPRFFIIPSDDDKTYIILLEDIIRYELKDIFYMFEFNTIESYIVKINRDAELDIDDDVSDSYIRAVAKSLEKRGQSEPIRFVYDKSIPDGFLRILLKRLHFSKSDTVIGSGRIHNFRDFINFPKVGRPALFYERLLPVKHKRIVLGKSYIESIRESDIMFHFPYHSFTHFVDLLREASIDPKVTEIKLTVYRVAKNSGVLNALINAARNGKKVTVVLELRARFSEKDNIRWGNELSKENVKVLFGVQGLKVHSKLCLIARKAKAFACVGTGNFNEESARVFSDQLLCTADERIVNEVSQVFHFFERNYRIGHFRHLLVSPFTTRDKMTQFINNEIRNARSGKKALIYFKCNNFADVNIMKKLHKAAKAGVDVKLNVRGMFSLLPTPSGKEYTIPCIGIVDRFLEHSRIYMFYNNGNEKIYISSADLMMRNLDRRIEVGVPVYDTAIREEIKQMLNIQWQDNTSARILDNELSNTIRKTEERGSTRSQLQFYEYIKENHS